MGGITGHALARSNTETHCTSRFRNRQSSRWCSSRRYARCSSRSPPTKCPRSSRRRCYRKETSAVGRWRTRGTRARSPDDSGQRRSLRRTGGKVRRGMPWLYAPSWRRMHRHQSSRACRSTLPRCRRWERTGLLSPARSRAVRRQDRSL